MAAANSADISSSAPLELNLGNLSADSLIPRRNRTLSVADQERIASILAGEPDNDSSDGEAGIDDDDVAQPDEEGDDDEEEFEDADDDDAEIAAEAGVNGTYVGVLCSGLMWSQSQVCTLPAYSISYDFADLLLHQFPSCLRNGHVRDTLLQLLLTRDGITVLESGKVEAALVRAHDHTSRLFHLHCLP
jgi:hypothetical protein